MFNNTYNTISPKFSHSLPGVFESDEVTLLLLKECKVDEAIREEIINTQYKKHPNWNKTIKCTL